MALKRSKEIVIADILELCVVGASKTRIVYQTNMNFKTAGSYIDKLTGIGLLQIIIGDQIVYKTTERGREILRGIKSIQKEIVEPRI